MLYCVKTSKTRSIILDAANYSQLERLYKTKDFSTIKINFGIDTDKIKNYFDLKDNTIKSSSMFASGFTGFVIEGGEILDSNSKSSITHNDFQESIEEIFYPLIGKDIGGVVMTKEYIDKNATKLFFALITKLDEDGEALSTDD